MKHWTDKPRCRRMRTVFEVCILAASFAASAVFISNCGGCINIQVGPERWIPESDPVEQETPVPDHEPKWYEKYIDDVIKEH